MESDLIYFVLLVLLFVIGLIFKRVVLPKVKGRAGESRVALTLRRLSKDNYKVYNNIYLKDRARITQIDHLVLSVYGIFVIETKRYKGWIFGNENSKYWTQVLYKNKYKLYNPVWQNGSHVNFLRRILSEFDDSKFFPIVVFAGSAKLKKVKSSVPVIYRRKLLRTIRRQQEIVITHNKLERIDSLIRK